MKSVGLRLAVVVAAVYAAIASVIFVGLVDEATVLGAHRVTVSGETVTTEGRTLAGIVTEAAQQSDTLVVRQTRDLGDVSIRHLYPVPSSPEGFGADWIADGYPGFGHSITTVIHEASGLNGMDPRGTYFVFGAQQQAELVAEHFAALGYDESVTDSGFSIGQVAGWFLAGQMGPVTLVALLFMSLLVAVSGSSATKAYSVLKLHGYRRRDALLRDLTRNARFASAAVLGIAAAFLISLAFYNGLSQFGVLAGIASSLFGTGLLLILIVHILIVALIWDTPMLAGIKGRLGFKVTVPAAYFLRIPGLILAISLIATTSAAVGAAQQAEQARADLEAAGSAARIVFEGLVSPDEMDRLAVESGEWLKNQDAAGHTVLTQPFSTQLSDESFDVLVVNPTYLKLNPVLASDGSTVSVPRNDEVSILLPEGTDVTRAALGNLLGGRTHVAASAIQNATEVEIAPGQSHFLYESAPNDDRQPSALQNVALVVAGPGSGLISSDDYMAYASQSRLLMLDAQDAVAQTPPELMGTWIAAYIPVAQAAADDASNSLQFARVTGGSAAVALVVLVLTAVGLAQLHVRGNAQSILVKHLHGYRFRTIHRRLVRAELALVGVVLAWATIHSLITTIGSATGDGAARSDNALFQWLPLIAIAISILNFGLLFVLVHVKSQAMIRTQSEDTA